MENIENEKGLVCQTSPERYPLATEGYLRESCRAKLNFINPSL